MVRCQKQEEEEKESHQGVRGQELAGEGMTIAGTLVGELAGELQGTE